MMDTSALKRSYDEMVGEAVESEKEKEIKKEKEDMKEDIKEEVKKDIKEEIKEEEREDGEENDMDTDIIEVSSVAKEYMEFSSISRKKTCEYRWQKQAILGYMQLYELPYLSCTHGTFNEK